MTSVRKNRTEPCFSLYLELQTCTNKCSIPKNCTKRVKGTHIDKTCAICQNVRNLAKRAEIPVSIVGRKILDHLLCNHGCRKAQQRAQFCANRRNLEQPSAISKSVQFCFSQAPQPTLKRAPFFETRANLPNEQKLSKCAHFQTHKKLCSFDVPGINAASNTQGLQTGYIHVLKITTIYSIWSLQLSTGFVALFWGPPFETMRHDKDKL